MKIKINDKSDNREVKIIINDKEMDLQGCTGYELKRIAGKMMELKLIYIADDRDIEIEKNSD